jgi:hypothetical protein
LRIVGTMDGEIDVGDPIGETRGDDLGEVHDAPLGDSRTAERKPSLDRHHAVDLELPMTPPRALNSSRHIPTRLPQATGWCRRRSSSGSRAARHSVRRSRRCSSCSSRRVRTHRHHK